MGVNQLRQGTPKCSSAVEDRLRIWWVLIIWGILKVKRSLHDAGESSCHSIQLAPPVGPCLGESEGGARAPSLAPHSHAAASGRKSITFPLPLLGFHCREAVQSLLRWLLRPGQATAAVTAECWAQMSWALLPPVPTVPTQEGYGREEGNAQGLLEEPGSGGRARFEYE